MSEILRVVFVLLPAMLRMCEEHVPPELNKVSYTYNKLTHICDIFFPVFFFFEESVASIILSSQHFVLSLR